MTTDDEATDRELWQQASAGDAAAFGRLFDRHARAVYNHCFRLVASWAVAEDLTQATFLVAWRRGAGRGGGRDVTVTRDSMLPWLLAVANNVTRADRRSVARRLRLARRLPDETVPDHADDVADRVDDERRMAEVLAAVATLPRNQREALALCVWSGVSYAAAAAVLGVAEVSVRARVSKARSRLKGLLATPVVALASSQEEAP